VADRFWVGGSGNWTDDTNHWATTSGGAPGAGNLPTASDDVHFDANSNATGYTVTVNAGGSKVCRNLLFEAAPSSGTITFAGNSLFGGVSGSILALAGMSWTYSGSMPLNSTSPGNTLTWNGVQPAAVFNFTGVGGVWTLQDNMIQGAKTITLTNGSLNVNGKTLTTTSAINHGAGNTFSLSLSGGTLNCAGFNAADGLTLDGTGAWNFSGTITNAGSHATLSFGDTTFTGANASRTIPTGCTFKSLTWAPAATATLTLGDDTVVTGALSLTGKSSAAPLTVTTNPAMGFSAGSVSLTDVAFTNITALGASIPWSGTRLVDNGGNTNILFGTATALGGGGPIVHKKKPKKDDGEGWVEYWKRTQGGRSAPQPKREEVAASPEPKAPEKPARPAPTPAERARAVAQAVTLLPQPIPAPAQVEIIDPAIAERRAQEVAAAIARREETRRLLLKAQEEQDMVFVLMVLAAEGSA